jgi:hypothetical protein
MTEQPATMMPNNNDDSKKNRNRNLQPADDSEPSHNQNNQPTRRAPRLKQTSRLDDMMSNQQQQQTGRLSVREMNFGIPTNQGAQDHVKDTHGSTSWRMRILDVLHQRSTQRTLMFLLFLDICILFVEIFLLASYPPCHIIERDCISCCDAALHGDDDEHRFLAETGHSEELFCEEEGLEPNYEYPATCNEHKWHRVHKGETFLFSLTILILSIFLVELNLEMVALGPKVFFRQFFFLLDYCIVSVSLALELTFHFASAEALQSLVGMLVFARVWRFVRIGHGIVEITSEWTHQQYEEVMEYAERLEAILLENNLPLPEAAGKIHLAKEHPSGSGSVSEESKEKAK